MSPAAGGVVGLAAQFEGLAVGECQVCATVRIQVCGAATGAGHAIEGRFDASTCRLQPCRSRESLPNVVQHLFFHVGQHIVHPAARLVLAKSVFRVSQPRPTPPTGRQVTKCTLMTVERQRQLPDVVGTFGAACRLAGCLNCRQQQCHQDPDNGDHHEQFHQRERTSPTRLIAFSRRMFAWSSLVTMHDSRQFLLVE